MYLYSDPIPLQPAHEGLTPYRSGNKCSARKFFCILQRPLFQRMLALPTNIMRIREWGKRVDVVWVYEAPARFHCSTVNKDCYR